MAEKDGKMAEGDWSPGNPLSAQARDSNPEGPVDPALEGFGTVPSLEPDGVGPDPLQTPAEAAPPPLEIRATEGRREIPGPDWSPGGPALPADPGLSEEEVEADRILLDDGFLKRTFKEVHFPASREMCIRLVDQEQDFAYGLDRTVNLHHLIAQLDVEEFRTRGDLIRAIKEQLHHHV